MNDFYNSPVLAVIPPNMTLVVIGWIFHISAFILVSLHCLARRREASSTIVWMFIAWSFPFFGPLFYLMFGIDRVSMKGFKKHVTDEKLLAERKAREDEAMPLAYWRSVRQMVQTQPPLEPEREFDRAIDSILPDYPLLGGNEIKPLISGDELYPCIFEAMRRATHHVHIQSFIIEADKTGRDLMTLLSDKARSGVKVRVLFDRFGSTHAFLTGFFRQYSGIPNLQIEGWTQANLLKRQFQINLRNHRKTIIVDGREAFCGGINIGDINTTRGDIKPIRDYHFSLRGPIVQELQYSFMRDWYYITDENPEELLNETYFPRITPVGASLIRMINSGPASEMEAIADVFFAALNMARKQILLVTPYFVPPRDIIRSLRIAALRGVDVRLVVPEENNHFYAGLASRALYEELLQAGVRIFERHPPFMHAKGLIIDDTIAIVGTSNFDFRSLRLNYETDLVVYDDIFVNKLKEIIIEDIAMSSEVYLNEWRKRPVFAKMSENLAYLMMPVL